MLNLPKCIVKQASTYKISDLVGLLEEGTALTSVLQNGSIVVALSTGDADEDFRGIAQNKHAAAQYAVLPESFSAPGASPYTVQLAKRPFGTEYAFYINGVKATVVTTGTPTTGQVKIANTGLLTFAAADAGKPVSALYRYELTQSESVFLHGYDPIPFVRNTEVETTVIEVGLVYTDRYIVSDDWAGSKYAYLAADGFLTTDNTGTRVGPVAGLPSANDGFLGVEISV